MICLINSQGLKCLVGLTYVWDIAKFELQKGTKRRPVITQSMASTSFW